MGEKAKGMQHVFHFITGTEPEGLNEQLRTGTNCTAFYLHTCQPAWIHRAENGGPVRRERNMASVGAKVYCFAPVGATLVIFHKYVQKAGNERTYQFHNTPSF
jgi:hypothetical protein